MSAKDLRLAPIARADADRIIRRLHYSGKVVPNSFLHLGVFYRGELEGALQIGPCMDKGKLIDIVSDTPWNGFAEINRMAFSERLPRNSESRALGVTMRLLRARYPHLQWIVSFADATQCGDGTIYRAAGFVLTQIRENITIWVFPTGDRVANLVLTADWDCPLVADLCRRMGVEHRYRRLSEWAALGAYKAPGFQLRYLYFLDPSARARLVAPELPFAAITEAGAAMYRGVRGKQAMADYPSAQRCGSGNLHAPSGSPGDSPREAAGGPPPRRPRPGQDRAPAPAGGGDPGRLDEAAGRDPGEAQGAPAGEAMPEAGRAPGRDPGRLDEAGEAAGRARAAA